MPAGSPQELSTNIDPNLKRKTNFATRYSLINKCSLLSEDANRIIEFFKNFPSLTIENDGSVSGQFTSNLFYDKAVSYRVDGLPEGVPPPVSIQQLEDQTRMEITFPIHSKDPTDIIYNKPYLTIGEKVVPNITVFKSIDEPSRIEILPNSQAVVENITLNKKGRQNILLHENSKLDIKYVDAETSSLRPFINLSEGSIITIPQNDPFILDAELNANNASLVFVDNQGNSWTYKNITCKQVTLRQALEGFQERPQENKKIFTVDDFERYYSRAATLERKTLQMFKNELEPLSEDVINIRDKNGTNWKSLFLMGGGKYCKTYFVYNQGNQPGIAKVSSDELDEKEKRDFNSEPERLLFINQNLDDLGLTRENSAYAPKLTSIGKTTSGKDFFIMEYADGAPVDEILYYQLPLKDSLTIALQTTGLFMGLHKTGYSYHDFQPKNVRWNPVEGKTTIIDFNLLKYINSESTQLIHEDTKKVGELLYKMVTGRSFDPNLSSDEQIRLLPDIPDCPLQFVIESVFDGRINKPEDLHKILQGIITNSAKEITDYDNLLTADPSRKTQLEKHEPLKPIIKTITSTTYAN